VQIDDAAPLLSEAVAARTAAICRSLGELDTDGLLSPSSLPGWSRLTIACHLRYGARALSRMTADAVAGRPTAYYPLGRADQRPGTLEPAPGEEPAGVVASLDEASAALTEDWRSLAPGGWGLPVLEPAGQVDLGPTTIATLVLLRLTEVEVHGTDLDLGLPPWGRLFVTTALPFRLSWLGTRRSNHRAVDDAIRGSWLLVSSDGPTWFVAVDDDGVRSEPATDGTTANATIEGPGVDLLALLLGRRSVDGLVVRGDATLAAAFSRTFPGP
jgi:uncharacterized protein (TIGR03083 family)